MFYIKLHHIEKMHNTKLHISFEIKGLGIYDDFIAKYISLFMCPTYKDQNKSSF